jgi:hypothetical protein
MLVRLLSGRRTSPPDLRLFVRLIRGFRVANQRDQWIVRLFTGHFILSVGCQRLWCLLWK